MSNKMNLVELKSAAMSFDRARTRDLYVKADGMESLCRTHMQVWNEDKGTQACVAPKRYQVLQHRFVTEVLVDALTSFGMKADARLKQAGHGIQIDIDFPEQTIELTTVGEKFTAGIHVVNDYSKTQGLLIAPRVTRLACSNGMVVTEIVKPRRIKYSEELRVTVGTMMDQVLREIIDSDDKLQGVISACMKDSVEWSYATLFLRQLLCHKKHRNAVLGRLEHGKPVTRWSLYNAITDYATHGERLKPSVETWLHNKANLLMKHSIAEVAEQEKQARKVAG